MQQLSALSTSSSPSSSSTSEVDEQLAPLFATQSLKDVNSESSTWYSLTNGFPIFAAKEEEEQRESPEPHRCCPARTFWVRYSAAHRSILQCLDRIIPSLSNDPDVSSTIIESYFIQKACLVALDGSLILQDAGRVANFYQSIVAWRRRSFASWTLESS
jgi:hypothetical protein